MPDFECPSIIQQQIWQQVQQLHSTQIAPYELMIADYTGCLQRKRDLEVRVGVLEREKAELDDRVGALETQLAATDKLAAQDFATKAESFKVQLQRANSEITSLLRDKNKTLEELLSLRHQVDSLKSSHDEAQQQAELLKEETAGLKARLASLSRALDEEKAARNLAAAEAEARVSAKVSAEAEAERLRTDNLALEASLRKMMEKEADQLRKISEMHEEMMANQKRQQNEAGAASQLLGLLTRRRGSTPSSSNPPSASASAAATPSRRRSSAELPASITAAAAAAAAAGSSQQQQQQQQGGQAEGQLLWASLKEKMGLPVGPVHAAERQLPAAPVKTIQAHPGGVLSLEFERPGHLLATCGADKTVQTWDLNTNQHVTTFHGLMGAANEVSFSCDSRRLLGAGSDKRLLVWNTATGQVVHTLTGHGDAVTCVCCSPLHETTAVSTGEDRCIKVWDLNKGFSSRSLLYPKMPTALTLSMDGQTIITGHLDGTLCLWDLRQNRAGGQPLAEVRDHAGGILCVRPSAHPDRLLTAAKDNSLRLWDFRQLGTVQLFKAPHFTIGSTGSMRSSRCHAEISGDGRFVTAGAADGQVYVWDLKPQQQAGAPTSVAAAAAAMTAHPVVRQLKHHKEPVVAAGWSSNCCQLVTADKAGNLAFWQCLEL